MSLKEEFTKDYFMYHYNCEWDTNEFLGWDEVWICVEQLYSGYFKQLQTQVEELKEKNKWYKEYVRFNDMRSEMKQICITFKAYKKNVDILAKELEESLKDDPEWEKVDGKWKPAEGTRNGRTQGTG